MPHITVKLFPGREEEAKADLAKDLARMVSEKLDLDLSAVSVTMIEVEKEDWKAVYDEEIIKELKNLYIKPGYTK